MRNAPPKNTINSISSIIIKFSVNDSYFANTQILERIPILLIMKL